MKELTLYEISSEMQALNDLLEESGGEITPPIEAWLIEYGTAMVKKTDSYASLVTNLENRVDTIRAEEKRLAERRAVINNRIDRIKSFAMDCMKRLDVTKLEGDKFTLTIAKSGGKQALRILDENAVPDRYRDVIPESYPINNEKVRAGIDAEDPELVGKAELLPRSESLRIK